MRPASRAAAVLLAVPLLALGGCLIDEEPEAEATSLREEPAEPVAIEAWAPYQPGEEIPPERLEAERFDRSWEQYARKNRQARRAALSTGTRADESGTRAEEPETRADEIEREDTVGEGESQPTTALEGNPVLGRMREPAPTGPAQSGSDGEVASAQAPSAEDPPAAVSDSASEAWEDISAESLRTGEPRFPLATEGGGPTALRVQWLLDRVGYSPGILDGRWGKNTEKALYWLQDALDMEPTGRIDRALYDRLDAAVEESSPVRQYTVTAQDLEGPFTDVPDDPEAQAELECLCYASPEELLAERFHTTGELLAQLNPDADLKNLQEGTELWVPAVDVLEAGSAGEGAADAEIARLVISQGGFYVHALNDAGDVLYHFPSTMGSEYNPSPDGSFEVQGVAWNPNFHYQPELLSSPDEEQTVEEDLMLPPGPNGPVGLVWIQLSKPHYGIHGTGQPETIGYSTSHGCIRLTNWDAIFLGQRVSPGTPVEFTP